MGQSTTSTTSRSGADYGARKEFKVIALSGETVGIVIGAALATVIQSLVKPTTSPCR